MAWGAHTLNAQTNMINNINLTRAKRISGWMSDRELEFLAHAAKKSQLIVEIGCYFGRSSMALADNTDGVVICVDPYEGYYETPSNAIRLEFDEPVYQDFLYNMSAHLDAGKVIHYRAKIDEVYANFVKNADFVFIDGDHSYEGCKWDIHYAKDMVKKGIIAGHDYGTPGYQGVDRAVKELLGEPNVVDTLWWCQI